MSNELLTLAWAAEVPRGPKFVLVALADKANREGVCWPSRALLASMTGSNPGTVSEHLKWLLERGFISQRRGRQSAAVYTVNRSALVSTQDVGKPDILSEVSAGQGLRLVDPTEPQDVGKQDVLNSDISNQDVRFSGQDVGNPDIPKENPHRTLKRRGRDDEDNLEAQKLCQILSDALKARDCRNQTITQAWLREARLLLTKDARPWDEVVAVLEWSQGHHFWKTNVLSMPKFRHQYDQLRLQAEAEGGLVRKPQPITDKAGAREWLLAQWSTGTVADITKRTGLRYQAPDLPLSISSAKEGEEFHVNHRKQWITDNNAQIISILVGEQQAA